ncbi:MAG: hypothetical protein EON92_18400, partial [Burkholderiales bacterium]
RRTPQMNCGRSATYCGIFGTPPVSPPFGGCDVLHHAVTGRHENQGLSSAARNPCLGLSGCRTIAMNTDAGRDRGILTPRRLALLLVPLLAAAGFVLHQRANATPSAVAIASQARPAMTAELARAPRGFVLVAGDSHAAALRLPCEVVNVAVGGLRADDIEVHLSQLPLPVEPSAVLLIAGTNDLRRKLRPLERIDDWVAEVRQIVSRFRNVVVTAIPPIGSQMTSVFDPDAVHIYSHRLENLCSEIGCRYVDPWKALRSGHFGAAKADVTVDGVHLADYGIPAGTIAAAVCPKAAGQPPAIESVTAE